MKNFTLSSLLFLIVTIIAGCKENSKPVISETKNNLPEITVEEALKNHGFPKLFNLAGDGNISAQHFVSVAYLIGLGVPKNYLESEKWALRAANQGSSVDQYLIGFLRLDSLNNEKNPLAFLDKSLQSYMWFSLAAAQGHEKSRVERDKLQPILGSSVDKAQKMAANWRPCHERTCWDNEPNSSTYK